MQAGIPEEGDVLGEGRLEGVVSHRVAAVLHDAQATSRRRLMELAGRKDAAMLVPVVFLVLPTVVAVALFPGLQGLRLVVP